MVPVCFYLMLRFSCATTHMVPVRSYLMLNFSCARSTQQPTWHTCVHCWFFFFIFGSSSSSLFLYLLLLCDVQVPDEASVVAEAKARLPSEPDSSDPNGCRIGEPFHHFLLLFSAETAEF